MSATRRDRTRSQPETKAGEHDDGRERGAPRLALRRRTLVAIGGCVLVFGFIVTNALFLQPGPHPAPLFASAPELQTSADGMGSTQVASTTTPAAPAQPAPAEAPPDNLVAAIQTALAERGLYSGTVDGMMGPATRTAIAAYETKAGLEATGAPSVGLLASLSTPAETTPPKPQAAEPSRATVEQLQKALVDAGYGPITVDGLYGSETAGAIRRYELDHGLSVTGKVSGTILSRLGVAPAGPEG
ncbi:peptidoglycan-binding protein [Amorphus sp. 3PC139-8]|uniref:peptidoglycan-binding domain-containing protein n=1 Tax=Amorphus sp. 3PC139-8 TaxID=2735676 RepID=UPI00345C81C1